MVKKFTAFKVLIALIILGIIAIPVTALISLTQFKFYPNPMDTLTPGAIDSNGIITRNFTIYASNYGFYDVNSLTLVTKVLNSSFYTYSEPNFMFSFVPKGGMMPINIVMRVNTTTLNTTGTIGDFLNTTSFFGQIILNARYAFSLTDLSTLQITQIGTMSPMFNLTIGPAVLDLITNTTANITFGFGNFLQNYNLIINADLYDISGPPTLVASGSYSNPVPSATLYMPAVFTDNITISTGGAAIVAGTGYELRFTVTAPFGYVYTNSTYEVVPT